jgi:hypothetical protein
LPDFAFELSETFIILPQTRAFRLKIYIAVRLCTKTKKIAEKFNFPVKQAALETAILVTRSAKRLA